MLDRFDISLLNLIQRDDGQTADALAEKVALSPSAIARRLRRLRSEGAERAIYVACLFLRGRATGLEDLHAAFPSIDPDSFGGRLVLRALGHYPTGKDLEFLARQFPLEGHTAGSEP